MGGLEQVRAAPERPDGPVGLRRLSQRMPSSTVTRTSEPSMNASCAASNTHGAAAFDGWSRAQSDFGQFPSVSSALAIDDTLSHAMQPTA